MKQVNLLFKNIYINGILAKEEDKKRFIEDYKNNKVYVKSIIVNEQLDYCIIETF